MTPLTRLDSIALPLPIEGIDTDQLIPARFMKRPRADGYGRFLLHDLAPPALQDPRFAGAEILVARRNFGGGSSREAAVYALADAGFRCVVAPSFGDIFSANAVGQGLLPAVLPEAAVEHLLAHAEAGRRVTVDLDTLSIVAGNNSWTFDLDPVWREKLLHGWDDIDLTRARGHEIEAFIEADRLRRPWAHPAAPG